jgi:hypothetical protein
VADDTAGEQPGLPAHLRDDLKWQPGQSGNPAGRPKGARNKLSEDFFKALAEDFAENGAAAIISMRTERPGDYAKMIAALQSKEFTGEDGTALGVVVFKGLNDG